MNPWLGIAVLIVAATASAQTIFVDHFPGPRLGEHWRLDRKFGEMEYTVSNGVLNVTRVVPGITGGSINSANMLANLNAPGNFHLRAVMGWDPGITQAISVSMMAYPSIFPPVLAQIGFSRSGGGAGTIAAGINYGSAGGSRPAPPPGLHEFSLARTNGVFSAWFNGELLAQAPDSEGRAALAVLFRFSGPDSPQFGPLHVDSIEVFVPSPGAAGVLLVASAAVRRRRSVSGLKGAQ